jgi:hypothetical protein
MYPDKQPQTPEDASLDFRTGEVARVQRSEVV